MFLYCFPFLLPSTSFRELYRFFLIDHPISNALNNVRQWSYDLKTFFYSSLHPTLTIVPFYSSTETIKHMMEPKFWGNALWTLMETILVSYDLDNTEVTQSVHMFLYCLQNLIPCSQCRSHYREFMKKHFFIEKLHHRMHMFRWCYLLKKEVYHRTHPTKSFSSFPQYCLFLSTHYSS
jgi:hypothetical protein